MIGKYLPQRNFLKNRSCLLTWYRLSLNGVLHIQLHLKPGNWTVGHSGPLNTAAVTHIHFNEAALNLAPYQTFAQLHTMVFPVNVKLTVMIHRLLCCQNRIHHTAGYRIQAVYSGIHSCKRHILTILNHNILVFQPAVHIIKIQHRVNISAVTGILSLFLLGNTGP